MYFYFFFANQKTYFHNSIHSFCSAFSNKFALELKKIIYDSVESMTLFGPEIVLMMKKISRIFQKMDFR